MLRQYPRCVTRVSPDDGSIGLLIPARTDGPPDSCPPGHPFGHHHGEYTHTGPPTQGSDDAFCLRMNLNEAGGRGTQQEGRERGSRLARDDTWPLLEGW